MPLKDVSLKVLEQTLKELGDDAIAQHSQRFFKTGKGEYAEGDRFLGIRVPVLRKLAKRYRKLPMAAVNRLLTSEFHEERQLALFLLVARFQSSGEADRQKLYYLYLKHTAFINNWDLVDGSAEHIVGAYLFNRDRKPLYSLVRSDDLWERRIAILSTYHFIKRNDFADALKIFEMVLADKEDLIHKAAGWMLREIGKRDIEAEEIFLKKHYHKMPRTMLRYAIEKFPEEKRQAYLKKTV
jgi:3-methyladenine DNA glycosylase AlkD